MIGNYHKQYAGQLWNTIDERFMDPKYFPKKWSNPVNPLYRVSRPLKELLDRSLSPPSAHRLSPPLTEMVERSTRKTVVFHQPCGDGVRKLSLHTIRSAHRRKLAATSGQIDATEKQAMKEETKHWNSSFLIVRKL